jgi:hypothetical protein
MRCDTMIRVKRVANDATHRLQKPARHFRPVQRAGKNRRSSRIFHSEPVGKIETAAAVAVDRVVIQAAIRISAKSAWPRRPGNRASDPTLGQVPTPGAALQLAAFKSTACNVPLVKRPGAGGICPMTEEKRSNNPHGVGGIQPSSKSQSRRKPAAGAHGNRSRLNNTVIPNQRQKRSNAQKHGVFVVNPAMPGEDPREFQELFLALADEWKPSGLTEEDAVFGLADAIWRKLRLQKFIRAKLIASTFDINNPAFDEGQGLAVFSSCMIAVPEEAFEQYARKLLRPDKIDYLKEKLPRSNYKSTSEWAEAVRMEIKSVLLPANEPAKELDDLTELGRKMAGEIQMALFIDQESELFEHELRLRERLDAMIARSVKHLVQTKATKQMLHQTNALERADEQPRKIAAKIPSDGS